MRAHFVVVVLMLVLPSQLTGITTSSDHKEEPKPPNITSLVDKEVLSPASTSHINITERQRRLIPYMTFYLTRNYDRPSNHLQELREPQPPPPPPSHQQQQYRLVPQKITVQPFQGKIILVNQVNQPKYTETTPVLYQPKIRYTPFLESNKLPGGFTPMRNPHHQDQPIRVQVLNPQPQPVQQVHHQIQQQFHHVQPQNQPQQILVNKEPNYSGIFDKLLQLKQLQYNKAPQYETVPQYQSPKLNVETQYFTRNYATPRPATKFITVENYQPENYKPVPPAKTYIHTYTPANIDISNENKVRNYENFESLKTYNQIPAPIPSKEYQPIVVPVKNYQIEQQEPVKNYQIEQQEPVKNYQIEQQVPVKNYQIEQQEPIKNYQIEQQEPEYQQIPQIQNNQHPQPSSQEEKNYEPIVIRPIYRPVPVDVRTYRPVYHQPIEHTESTQSYTPTENPHSLTVILKQLQDSNTLPQTLTPDNIDNSIKTLVQILNALKHTQKFQRPIVVTQTDDSAEPQLEENIDEYDDSILPETVSQSYPANTQEGGTPGKPGIDYPAHSIIPQTNFNCKKQRYKGFFGDPDTSCQVWHYCDLNGGQASFLCPNGTIFSQVALTCDWWYNVKCATTTQLYVLNERLYKYILPFTPKFPEDYSGPLVDRYLALKFKEMEEKMKKQKKGKTEKTAEDVRESEANKLEDIQAEPEEEVDEIQEHTTQTSQEEKDSH